MGITQELLESLCDADRPSISKPFSVQLDGHWWNGCTNGHGLLLVRHDVGEFKLGAFKRDDSPPVERIFKPSKAKPTHLARFSLLVKWFDICEKWENCEACKGTGVHDCNCWHCEILEKSVCAECEGDKGFWKQTQVDHEGWSLNRVLAARFLAPFADTEGDVEMFFGGELDPIEFRRPEWKVALMPMRRDEGNKTTTGTIPEGLIRKAGAGA